MKIYKYLKSNFIRGVWKGFLYYALGTIFTWLTYIIVGWEYKHAPGLFHFVAFLFLLGGAIWTLYYFVLLLIGKKSKINLGVLTIHLIVILSSVISMYIGIKKEYERTAEYNTSPENILTEEISSETKSILLKADRETPLGWVYLTIYQDSTFEFTSAGLRSKTVFDGKVEIRNDSLFFTYTDSIPKAGKTAVYNDKVVGYIDGEYPERLNISLTELTNE